MLLTTMPRKRHKREEVVPKLRQVDVLVSQGGGLKSDQVKRLKDLERPESGPVPEW